MRGVTHRHSAPVYLHRQYPLYPSFRWDAVLRRRLYNSSDNYLPMQMSAREKMSQYMGSKSGGNTVLERPDLYRSERHMQYPPKFGRNRRCPLLATNHDCRPD